MFRCLLSLPLTFSVHDIHCHPSLDCGKLASYSTDPIGPKIINSQEMKHYHAQPLKQLPKHSKSLQDDAVTGCKINILS